MSDNPLETNPKREAEIKARAKSLWEAAGSPEGPMDDYMERADELVRMEGSGIPGQKAIDEPEFVEEASIQENLGEFPGQQQDQGDRMVTPMTRDEMHEALEEDEGGTTPAAGVTGERVNTKSA